MNNLTSLLTPLDQGLQTLQLELSERNKKILLDYLYLLQKWNKAYNLTAIRDIHEMVSYHLLDSLSITPFIQGQRLLDVGTGAGLPGIPLAIAFPDKEWILLDSHTKKIAFLQHIKHSLNLTNVSIVNARVESYQDQIGFDAIVSRAFASLQEMLKATHHLCHKNGRFIAMKGRYPEKELIAIAEHYKIISIQALKIPGVNAARHVIVMAFKSLPGDPSLCSG